MASTKLTHKQRRFCEEYVIDWNGTRAAIAAGYSIKTARQIASENLSKPYIQDYIEEIQKDLSKLSGVTALRNILELKKMAYSNISDLKQDWLIEKEFNSLDSAVKAALSEIQYTIRQIGDENGDIYEKIVKFKMHDKKGAIVELNKMLGFNAPTKLEVTDKRLTESERLARIAEIKDKLKD